jgi:hypothetical protein
MEQDRQGEAAEAVADVDEWAGRLRLVREEVVSVHNVAKKCRTQPANPVTKRFVQSVVYV